MTFHNEIITSRNNPTVKWAASLSDKKGRNESKAFIAEGEKLTFEAINSGLLLTYIFINEEKSEKILLKLRRYQENENLKECKVIVLSDSAFQKISTEKSPQGIISIIKYLDFFCNMDIIYKEDFFLKPGERTLALFSLRDPNNLGSVIRSAVAFGVEHIVLTSDSADIYNSKTVRSAMGSLFKVKVTVVDDFSSFINTARFCGRRIYAAELTERAKSLSNIKLSADDIFVIGNEGHGISPEISDLCDGSVFIPISGKTESLNASVAAAIFMWEQNRI